MDITQLRRLKLDELAGERTVKFSSRTVYSLTLGIYRTGYYAYVTDDKRKLVSVVSRQLLFSIPDVLIGEIASNRVNGYLCISGSHNGDIVAPPTWARLL